MVNGRLIWPERLEMALVGNIMWEDMMDWVEEEDVGCVN
jgi:hypothetical protein